MPQTTQTDLFGNFKYCERCSRPLPLSYKHELCPDCIEHELFDEVREYIRANTVNEYDVAEHFHIPRQQVIKWIRQGRIEYKDERLNTINSLFCKKCGASIPFGSLCSKCSKLAHSSGHSMPLQTENGHMRFLDKE